MKDGEVGGFGGLRETEGLEAGAHREAGGLGRPADCLRNKRGERGRRRKREILGDLEGGDSPGGNSPDPIWGLTGPPAGKGGPRTRSGPAPSPQLALNLLWPCGFWGESPGDLVDSLCLQVYPSSQPSPQLCCRLRWKKDLLFLSLSFPFFSQEEEEERVCVCVCVCVCVSCFYLIAGFSLMH